jgi:hypothetical protein
LYKSSALLSIRQYVYAHVQVMPLIRPADSGASRVKAVIDMSDAVCQLRTINKKHAKLTNTARIPAVRTAIHNLHPHTLSPVANIDELAADGVVIGITIVARYGIEQS